MSSGVDIAVDERNFLGYKTKAGLCFHAEVTVRNCLQIQPTRSRTEDRLNSTLVEAYTYSCLQFQSNGNHNIRSAPRPPLETASQKDQVHLISFTPTMGCISIAPPMFQMVSYTLPRSYSFFQVVPLLSTRKEPPNHSSRNIPRNTPSVQRTPRQIRRMPKFITSRKRKRVRNRQTQRDD
jgi:hypothetical protein